MTSSISQITLYPIKSLDGIQVQEAQIAPGGSLVGDREFALFDAEGIVINAKRTARIHEIRADFELDKRIITLSDGGEPIAFHLDRQKGDLEKWFADFFGFEIIMRQNTHRGFPDANTSNGPTVVSTQSLEAVQNWFSGDYDLENIRRRFRANIEIEAPYAFWEDELLGPLGEEFPFQIGEASLLARKACPRCPVPTRHPVTGEVHRAFSKTFSQEREKSLPEAVAKSQFPHYYMLSVSTRVEASQAGKVIRVGDEIKQ